MNNLWTSTDGRIVVIADAINWGKDEDGMTVGMSDLEEAFRAGAWIVFYQAQLDAPWFFARSRRHPKPSIKRLAHWMASDMLSINAEDGLGRIINDYNPINVAGEMEIAWQHAAAEELPRVLAKDIFADVDKAAPDIDRIPAWLRPGLPRYCEQRASLFADVAEE